MRVCNAISVVERVNKALQCFRRLRCLSLHGDEQWPVESWSEIQIQASLSRGRLRLIATDLSSPNAKIEDLVSRSSWTISSCLLSQLPLFSNEDSPTLFDRHLALLRKSPRAVLITDVAKRLGSGPWQSLIENHPLPHPAAEWMWTIAPAGESGPLAEERLVHAFVMND